MLNWLRNRRRTRPQTAARRPQRTRLTLEGLEDRCLLSITGQALAITPVEATPFSGKVATITNSDPNTQSIDQMVTVDWGDGTTTPGSLVNNGQGNFDVDANHTYAVNGSYPLRVTARDLRDNFSVTLSNTSSVADAPLTATADNFSAVERQPVSLVVATFGDANVTATPADFQVTIDWGDGTSSPGTVTGQSGSFSVHASHTYDADGNFAFAVQIHDVANPADPNASMVTARGTAAVSDVPPLEASGTTIKTTQDVVFTGVVASVTDISANPVGGYTATIDWGDGTQPSNGTVAANGNGGFDVTGSHRYTAQGNYVVRVTVQDAANHSDVALTNAQVAAAQLNAVAKDVTGQANVVNNNVVVATFTDASGPDAVGNYTASINWGDGTQATNGTLTVDQNGTFTVTGTHNYVQAGTYPIKVTLHEQGGATVTVGSNAFIGSVNERFVAKAYLDVLGRPADQGALSYWSGLLDRKAITRGQFVLVLVSTTEYRVHVVNGLYQSVLGRPADQAGLNFFVNFLAQGGTQQQVQAILLGSQEYFVNHGGNNSSFVAALWQDVLGRPIDAPSQQQLANLLNQGFSRTTLALLVVTSTEALTRVVQNLYQTFLRRPADQAGLNFYVNYLQRGGRVEFIIADMVGSDEYFANV